MERTTFVLALFAATAAIAGAQENSVDTPNDRESNPAMEIPAGELNPDAGLKMFDHPMRSTGMNAELTEYLGPPQMACTYGRTFEIARQEGVSQMFMLAQMSYWPAKYIGDTGLTAMQERGRL